MMNRELADDVTVGVQLAAPTDRAIRERIQQYNHSLICDYAAKRETTADDWRKELENFKKKEDVRSNAARKRSSLEEEFDRPEVQALLRKYNPTTPDFSEFDKEAREGDDLRSEYRQRVESHYKRLTSIDMTESSGYQSELPHSPPDLSAPQYRADSEANIPYHVGDSPHQTAGESWRDTEYKRYISDERLTPTPDNSFGETKDSRNSSAEIRPMLDRNRFRKSDSESKYNEPSNPVQFSEPQKSRFTQARLTAASLDNSDEDLSGVQAERWSRRRIPHDEVDNTRESANNVPSSRMTDSRGFGNRFDQKSDVASLAHDKANRTEPNLYKPSAINMDDNKCVKTNGLDRSSSPIPASDDFIPYRTRTSRTPEKTSSMNPYSREVVFPKESVKNSRNESPNIASFAGRSPEGEEARFSRNSHSLPQQWRHRSPENKSICPTSPKLLRGSEDGDSLSPKSATRPMTTREFAVTNAAKHRLQEVPQIVENKYDSDDDLSGHKSMPVFNKDNLGIDLYASRIAMSQKAFTASECSERSSRLDPHTYQSYTAGLLHSTRKSDRFLRMQKFYGNIERIAELEQELGKSVTGPCDRKIKQMKQKDKAVQNELAEIVDDVVKAQKKHKFVHNLGKLEQVQWNPKRERGLLSRPKSLGDLKKVFENEAEPLNTKTKKASEAEREEIRRQLSFVKLQEKYKEERNDTTDSIKPITRPHCDTRQTIIPVKMDYEVYVGQRGDSESSSSDSALHVRCVSQPHQTSTKPTQLQYSNSYKQSRFGSGVPDESSFIKPTAVSDIKNDKKSFSSEDSSKEMEDLFLSNKQTTDYKCPGSTSHDRKLAEPAYNSTNKRGFRPLPVYNHDFTDASSVKTFDSLSSKAPSIPTNTADGGLRKFAAAKRYWGGVEHTKENITKSFVKDTQMLDKSLYKLSGNVQPHLVDRENGGRSPPEYDRPPPDGIASSKSSDSYPDRSAYGRDSSLITDRPLRASSPVLSKYDTNRLQKPIEGSASLSPASIRRTEPPKPWSPKPKQDSSTRGSYDPLRRGPITEMNTNSELLQTRFDKPANTGQSSPSSWRSGAECQRQVKVELHRGSSLREQYPSNSSPSVRDQRVLDNLPEDRWQLPGLSDGRLHGRPSNSGDVSGPAHNDANTYRHKGVQNNPETGKKPFEHRALSTSALTDQTLDPEYGSLGKWSKIAVPQNLDKRVSEVAELTEGNLQKWAAMDLRDRNQSFDTESNDTMIVKEVKSLQLEKPSVSSRWEHTDKEPKQTQIDRRKSAPNTDEEPFVKRSVSEIKAQFESGYSSSASPGSAKSPDAIFGAGMKSSKSVPDIRGPAFDSSTTPHMDRDSRGHNPRPISYHDGWKQAPESYVNRQPASFGDWAPRTSSSAVSPPLRPAAPRGWTPSQPANIQQTSQPEFRSLQMLNNAKPSGFRPVSAREKEWRPPPKPMRGQPHPQYVPDQQSQPPVLSRSMSSGDGWQPAAEVKKWNTIGNPWSNPSDIRTGRQDPEALRHHHSTSELPTTRPSPSSTLERGTPADRKSRDEEDARRKHYLNILNEENKRKRAEEERKSQELRRHNDNFLPKQKSPIPEDRFDGVQPPRLDKKHKPLEIKGKARALYSFKAQNIKELSFRKNDLIYLLKKIDDNWYEAERHGMRGIVPLNYVEVVKSIEEAQSLAQRAEGFASVRYKFRKQNPIELNADKGEIVQLLRRVDENWYEARIHGHQGIIPASYLDVNREPDTPFITPAPSVVASAIHSTVTTPGPGTPVRPLSPLVPDPLSPPEWDFTKFYLPGMPVNRAESRDNTLRKHATLPRDYVSPVAAQREFAAPPSSRNRYYSESSIPPDTRSYGADHHMDDMRPDLGGDRYDSRYSTLDSRKSTDDHWSQPVQPRRRDVYADGHRAQPQLGHDEPLKAYRVLFNYLPQNDDELDIREGDHVYVLEKCDDGWFVGTSTRTGQFGTFPGNYVRPV